MPCPFFQPVLVAREPEHPGARLPLIEEYEGVCRADSNSMPSAKEDRFRCNHGYSRSVCAHFPLSDPRSAHRFHVLKIEDGAIQILWVEERNYAPAKWESVQYSIATGSLTPKPADQCLEAQIIAFCCSYYRRFLT
ncbi:MAG: hypothetical protein JO217_00875 [Acidobacteriaceae bacterium]|nr:hypothetical protein [Acidobacteriaceae bacterium]MBV9441222.1 hypothetical protein [Acidobacteriaceae bacterium]